MSKKSKPNSRWNKGNERYTKDVELWILSVFPETHGWYHGAKVYKSKKA